VGTSEGARRAQFAKGASECPKAQFAKGGIETRPKGADCEGGIGRNKLYVNPMIIPQKTISPAGHLLKRSRHIICESNDNTPQKFPLRGNY
jgi:hypothetical protein